MNISSPYLIIIPARMDALRLPGKPLADIQGKPMIIHAMQRAIEADIGPVYVACDTPRIAELVVSYHGRAILTDPALPSGTDRIYHAMQHIEEAKKAKYIINVQGDLPWIEPDIVQKTAHAILASHVDIATPVVQIKDKQMFHDSNVVKAIVSMKEGVKTGKSLYFTRSASPHGSESFLAHVGVYVFKKEALERFVHLPQSLLEKQEKLEQLRALENNMHIEAVCVDHFPISVDTPDDLIRAQNFLRQ